MCFRKFWREFIPITAKIPSWYSSARQQEKELFDARQQNIHFLHLPCNTLPGNKRYIVGCQCSSCTKDHSKDEHNLSFRENPYYFTDTIPWTITKWNNRYDHICSETEYGYECISHYPIFDPEYDISDPLQVKIHKNEVSFS